MKKNSTIHRTTAIVMTLSLFVASCSNIIEQPEENQEVQMSTYANSEPLTKSEMTALVVQQKGTYKVSKTEALEKLDNFAASVSDSKNTNIQVKSTSLKISPTTGKEMYYEVVFESEKGTGFSILSADERVDKVLCYSEVGSIADTLFNESLKFCLELVNLYVEEATKKELDLDVLTLSANEKLALNKQEILPDTKAIPPFNPNTWSYEGMHYDVIREDIRLKPIPLISGGWHQASPLNSLLPTLSGMDSEYNGRAKVGCVPLATAQIMAYWKKPFKTYLSTTSAWNSMLNSNPNTSTVLKQFIKDVFDKLIVENIEMGYAGYKPSGSWLDHSLSMRKIRIFLNSNGYTMDTTNSYSYALAWDALNYGPTIVDGVTTRGVEEETAHAWIIEGAKTVTEYWYELWTYGTYTHKIYNPTTIIQNYVKCRWGWDNENTAINTWFADRVFAVTRKPGTTYDFYDLRIVSRIY